MTCVTNRMKNVKQMTKKDTMKVIYIKNIDSNKKCLCIAFFICLLIFISYFNKVFNINLYFIKMLIIIKIKN